jgi:hypothetical protein
LASAIAVACRSPETARHAWALVRAGAAFTGGKPAERPAEDTQPEEPQLEAA